MKCLKADKIVDENVCLLLLSRVLVGTLFAAEQPLQLALFLLPLLGIARSLGLRFFALARSQNSMNLL